MGGGGGGVGDLMSGVAKPTEEEMEEQMRRITGEEE
jgi:hypothetical protein